MPLPVPPRGTGGWYVVLDDSTRDNKFDENKAGAGREFDRQLKSKHSVQRNNNSELSVRRLGRFVLGGMKFLPGEKKSNLRTGKPLLVMTLKTTRGIL